MKVLTLLLFLLVIGCLAWLDGKRVKQEHGKRDYYIYLAILGTVTVVGTLFFLGVRLPSPTDPIEKYIPPLSAITGGEG
jgi:hypothetical protein